MEFSSSIRRSLWVGVVFLCSLFATSLHSQTAGAGRTFTFCVPYVSPSTNGGAERIRLFFASEARATVSIRVNASGVQQMLNIPPNSFGQFEFDTTDISLPSAEGTFNRTILVESTVPIVASMLLDRGTASEAYGAIADSLLGFEYVAVGTQSYGPGSFVAVAATEDETTVRITPDIVTLNDNPPGVPFTIKLNRGEVYQVLTKLRIDPADDDDLTGTHIIADRPIAVWSGTACTRLPSGNETCGPLLEQLPAIEMQGRRHPLGLYSSEERTYYHVVASCAGTTVQSTELIPALDTLLTSKNGHKFGESFQNGWIVTSQPALVAHLAPNISRRPPRYIDSAVGDPTMSLVTPVEQMGLKHRFQVPAITSRQDGGNVVSWRHFINIARSLPTAQVRLDGVPVPFVGDYAIVDVESGPHEVLADAPVSVTLNGRSVSDAYAFVPAPVVKTWILSADSIAREICGDEFDTTIQVVNRTGEDVVVDSVEFLAGLQGELISPSVPFTVPANGTLSVRFRFRNLMAGVSSGSVVFRGGECLFRSLRIPVWLRPDRLELDPDPASVGLEFPPVYPAGAPSTVFVTLRNPSRYPLTVNNPFLTPGQFTVASPAFPITIPPRGLQVVTLRFTSLQDDRVVLGKAVFVTKNCSDPDQVPFGAFDLKGVVKRLQVIEPPPLTYLCEPKEDDTVTVQFINRGDAPINFDEAILSGDSEFTVLPEIVLPITLRPGDTIRFHILYVPGPLGSRQTIFTVKGVGDDFSSQDIPIRAQNDLLKIDVEPTEVDLGNRACDSTAARILRIINRGNVPANGVTVALRDGRKLIAYIDVPDQLDPGDTVETFLLPPDSSYGSLQDTVRIFVPECGTEYLVPVQGRCAVGHIEIAWGDEEGNIGEKVGIPLNLTARPTTFAEKAEVNIRVIGHLKADILLPSGLLLNTVNELTAELISQRIENKMRIVEIELKGTLPPNGVLTVMDALALLGSDTVTPITIDSIDFRFLSDIYEAQVTTRDGSFREHGFCYVNYTRLVNALGSFGMRVTPNPATEQAEIQLDLVEDGNTSLRLINEAGETAATILSGDILSGSWRIVVPLTDLPSGYYRLLLTTPTQTSSMPLHVVR